MQSAFLLVILFYFCYKIIYNLKKKDFVIFNYIDFVL